MNAMNNPRKRVMYFYLQCSQTLYHMMFQRKHHIVLIKGFLKIIDIIGQFVVPNRGAIKETKEILTFTLCQFFDLFSSDCSKVEVSFVSVKHNPV